MKITYLNLMALMVTLVNLFGCVHMQKKYKQPLYASDDTLFDFVPPRNFKGILPDSLKSQYSGRIECKIMLDPSANILGIELHSLKVYDKPTNMVLFQCEENSPCEGVIVNSNIFMSHFSQYIFGGKFFPLESMKPKIKSKNMIFFRISIR